jgi:hypothetical protein
MNLVNHVIKLNLKNVLSKTFSCFLGLIILSAVFTSCSDTDEVTETENVLEDTVALKRSTEIDQMDSVLADFIIEVYEEEESGIEDRSVASSNIPQCVTITVVAEQNYRQVTIDFGAEGCLVNGHFIRGEIVFDYTRDSEAQQIAINYNLVDFYFDAKNVIGSRSILRELSNVNGNPQFTHTIDVTVIWPNGVQASREGTRVREWVEGFGSGVFSDNVFEIRGTWSATFVNGNTHTYNVLTPLRREVGCPYFVSGSFDVQRTNFGGIFNYGDGDCDTEASFTFNNGQEIEITLN